MYGSVFAITGGVVVVWAVDVEVVMVDVLVAIVGILVVRMYEGEGAARAGKIVRKNVAATMKQSLIPPKTWLFMPMIMDEYTGFPETLQKN